MTRAAAIKAARGKVDMHRFGRQWCVDVLSEEHRAWWSGRPSTYQSALRQKRSAIIGRALEFLLPADLPIHYRYPFLLLAALPQQQTQLTQHWLLSVSDWPLLDIFFS